MTRKFKFLITDLDGTLASLPIVFDDIRSKIRAFLKTDHPLRPLAVSIPIATGGNKDLMEKAFKIIEEEELKATSQATYNPELHNFLKRLKAEGFKIGLVTQQGQKPAEIALKRMQIYELFDVLVARERVIDRTEQLRLALKLLDGAPEETIYLGDSPMDLEAGKLVGCFTVIVGERVPNAPLKISKFIDVEKLIANHK
jgi:HAD superfamily hydrolase (TIGR01549 family)